MTLSHETGTVAALQTSTFIVCKGSMCKKVDDALPTEVRRGKPNAVLQDGYVESAWAL